MPSCGFTLDVGCQGWRYLRGARGFVRELQFKFRYEGPCNVVAELVDDG